MSVFFLFDINKEQLRQQIDDVLDSNMPQDTKKELDHLLGEILN